jgi:hypothetical protein
MSHCIRVDTYTGYRANKQPQQFVFKDHMYEIAGVLDQWYDESAMFCKVRSKENKTYVLRYDAQTDEWTLQSDFDGDELLAQPSNKLITVDVDLIRQAEKQIETR